MTKMVSLALIVAVVLMRGTDAVPVFPETDNEATASVPEGAAVGTPVYQLNVTGATDTVTYTVKEGEDVSDIFEAPESEVKIKQSASIDHETKATYTLTITASDASPADSDPPLTLTVNVENVAPSFTITPPAPVNVSHETAAGTAVGTYAATDPGSSAVKISIACGNTNSDFAINETSGSMAVAKTIDDARTACYTLVLHAADTGSPALTATATVLVTVTGGANGETCEVDTNPSCNTGGNSGASLLAVPLFVMVLWISSYILK